MERPCRVLSLIRVSGKPQIDRTGIPRQIDAIAQICKEHNLIVAEGDEYRFEGLSGASVDKFPKFIAMLDRLKDPEIAGIVFSEISRLFRPEFPDQMVISKPFRQNGKRMFYEDGILDLRNSKDQETFVNQAMKAGEHRKRIIKWTQWGRNERRNRGDCQSDPLPRGVDFVPHPKIKDELVVGHFKYTEEADRMKEAFRRVLAGESYSKIARELDFYSASQLRDYLRSRWWIQEKASFKKRINAGLREDGTEYSGYRQKREEPIIVPAKFNCANCPREEKDIYQEPLISRKMFDAVQAILDRTERTWIRSTDDRTNSPYIGIGVLVCARCGRKLYTKPNKKAGKFYYRCSSYNNGNTPCGAPHVHQADMDKELRLFAVVRLKNRKYIESLVPELPRINVVILEKQKAGLEKRLDALYTKLDDPKWDQARIQKQIETVTQQQKDLDAQLAVASKPVKAHVDVDEIRRRFTNFAKLPLAEQRETIRKTFAKVIVDYDDEDMKPVIIRVELRAQP